MLAAVEDRTLPIVRRLRDDPAAMSRNRNFHAFVDPTGFRALRIARHLRSVERAVRGGASCQAERPAQADGLVRVRMEHPEIRATRTAYLSPQEYAMLLEDPEVCALLA